MAGSPQKKQRADRWKAWTAKPGEAMDELCDWIETQGALGHLLAFSRVKDFAYTTLRRWIDADDQRLAMYARAKDRRADVLAEELIELADEAPPTVETQFGSHVDAAAVAHQKLRIDTRKWVAAKLAPRRYSEKLELDGSLKHTHDATEELRQYLQQTGSRLPVREDV